MSYLAEAEPEEIETIASFEALLAEAAIRFHVTAAAILGRGRTKTVYLARQWAMREAQARFAWSDREVGCAFKRNRTTVLAACASQEWREQRAVAKKVALVRRSA